MHVSMQVLQAAERIKGTQRVRLIWSSCMVSYDLHIMVFIARTSMRTPHMICRRLVWLHNRRSFSTTLVSQFEHQVVDSNFANLVPAARIQPVSAGADNLAFLKFILNCFILSLLSIPHHTVVLNNFFPLIWTLKMQTKNFTSKQKLAFLLGLNSISWIRCFRFCVLILCFRLHALDLMEAFWPWSSLDEVDFVIPFHACHD